MSGHQDIGTILRNAYKGSQRGQGQQSNLDQDYSQIKWNHEKASLDSPKLVPGRSKSVTDKVLATENGIIANQRMKITVNMHNSFSIAMGDCKTVVSMKIPKDIRQNFPASPDNISFPVAGKITNNMDLSCPLPSHIKGKTGQKLKLRFEEKQYTGKVEVVTRFHGQAVFGGKDTVDVKQAIASMSSRSNQCTASGDFISLGTYTIETRTYLGMA